MKAALLTAAVFLAWQGAAPAAPLGAAQIAQIDRIAAQALAAQHISGMEIGVGRNGKILFARGYGLRDRAQRLPVNSRTVFPLGSITKQFTAAAVMLLRSEGKVDLNAPVSRYLRFAPHGRETTVRELLDQTSGLPDYLENKPLLTSIMAGTVGARPVRTLVELVANKPLHFKPGSKWEYSNTNYALAGLLVSAVSGMPYAEFVRRRILSPLRLESTQYLQTSIPSGPDASHGYTYRNGTFVALRRFNMTWANAAGALASDAGDVIRWDGAFFGGALLSKADVRIATTPPAHVRMTPSKNPANNIGIGYAFGWVQARAEGRQLIWHNGGLPGARAMNAVFPADGLEVVVLTNVTDAEPENVALKIARAIYDGPR